jgi:hypothetical protein
MTTPANDSMAQEGAPVYRTMYDEVDAIERRLRDELRPEHFDLVTRWVWPEDQIENDAAARYVGAVAAHFPGFAPAIVAMYGHVIETGSLVECGLQVDEVRTWPGFDNCADATRPPRVQSRQSKKAAS